MQSIGSGESPGWVAFPVYLATVGILIFIAAGGPTAAGPPGVVQGTWTLSRAVVDGAGGLVRAGELSHDGARYVSTWLGSIRHKLRLDPGRKPSEIDWVRVEPPDAGKASPGIYAIEGDILRENFARPGSPRPDDFKTRPKSGHRLSVWRRTGKRPERAPADDRAVIEGTWDLIAVEFNGEPTAVRGSREVKGEDASTSFETIVRGRKSWDSTRTPKAVDITPDSGGGDGPLLGIYEADGGTYRECYGRPGGERPTEFSAPAGSGRTLLEYTRTEEKSR